MGKDGHYSATAIAAVSMHLPQKIDLSNKILLGYHKYVAVHNHLSDTAIVSLSAPAAGVQSGAAAAAGMSGSSSPSSSSSSEVSLSPGASLGA